MLSARAIVSLLLLSFISCAVGGDNYNNNNGPVKNQFPTEQNRQTICLYDGCVQGKAEQGNVRGYDAWYGIPFATPPLGQLRFRVIN